MIYLSTFTWNKIKIHIDPYNCQFPEQELLREGEITEHDLNQASSHLNRNAGPNENSNSINLKNQKMKEDDERERQKKLNIFLTNNFKSRTCSELLKNKFMAMKKFLIETKLYDFGFFISLSFLRWVFAPIIRRHEKWDDYFAMSKFFTWLKSFTCRSFKHCHWERIKLRETNNSRRSHSSRISNLATLHRDQFLRISAAHRKRWKNCLALII